MHALCFQFFIAGPPLLVIYYLFSLFSMFLFFTEGCIFLENSQFYCCPRLCNLCCSRGLRKKKDKASNKTSNAKRLLDVYTQNMTFI